MRNNNIGNSSTSSTTMSSSQQKRRPLHLMSEIETMMNQKSTQPSSSGGNRRISTTGFNDTATYSDCRTAVAVVSSSSSNSTTSGRASGSIDGRSTRQRRHYKRDNEDDSHISGEDCSGYSAVSSTSSLSFLRSHRGSSSTVGRGRSSSVMRMKDSFVYGGLFVLCGLMSYTVFWMDGLNHHYSYDLAAVAATTTSNQQQQQEPNANRQLSFLDPIWSDYGKDSFHFEYLLFQK